MVRMFGQNLYKKFMLRNEDAIDMNWALLVFSTQR